MHATSTPTLAQPKPSAFGAIAAVALAVGIAAGAIAAVNLAPTTVSLTNDAGSATQIEQGLKLQRQGEIGAGVTTTPVEVMPKSESITAPAITSLGGRDPMAYWNAYSLVGPSAIDLQRAAGGWYAFPPAAADGNTQPVGVSHR
ncbi:MAG: hypothetical protein ACSLFN_06950 [Candidatus Limnocylindrales bacterium]